MRDPSNHPVVAGIGSVAISLGVVSISGAIYYFSKGDAGTGWTDLVVTAICVGFVVWAAARSENL